MFSGDFCISSIFLFLCRLLHCATSVLSSANSDDPTHSPHERTPTRSQQSQVRGRRILSTPPNFESKRKYSQGHACHSNIATLYRTTSGDSPDGICVIPSKCHAFFVIPTYMFLFLWLFVFLLHKFSSIILYIVQSHTVHVPYLYLLPYPLV